MEKGSKMQQKDGLDRETLERCTESLNAIGKLEAKATELRAKVDAIEKRLADRKVVLNNREWHQQITERNSLLVDINTTETKIVNLRKGRNAHGDVIHEVSIKGV